MVPEHGIVHYRSQELVNWAYEFARDAHQGQVRKYTGEPYIVHPVSVAHHVASVTTDVEAICVALLHDVIEDTPVTEQDIADAGFEWTIARWVTQISDQSVPEDGNRAVRKAIDREHLSAAHPMVKTVKLADLLDNSHSIITHDPDFSVVFMKEINLLLPRLHEGDASLYGEVRTILNTWNERPLT